MTRSFFTRCLGICLALGFAVAHHADRCGAESWTSLSGSRTIEAKLVGMWGDSVVLQLDGDRRVTVNLMDLKAESRIQAQKLGVELKSFRKTIVDEIKSVAEEAAAPAPNPLPKPDPAPVYRPFKPGGTAVDQMEWMVSQFEAGHVIAAFDWLPNRYQNDLDQVVKLAATKIDSTAWHATISSIHHIGELIVTRQRWVFSHPRITAMGPDASQDVSDVVLPFAGLIRVGLDPKELQLNKVQSMPLRAWLMQRSQAMAPYMLVMNEMAGGTGSMTYEIKSEKDGVATVEISSGEGKSSVDFVLVDDHWITKDLADKWDDLVTEWKSNLSEIPDGSLMSGDMFALLPDMLSPMLSPMENAQDAQEFHAAMEPIFNLATPAVQTLASMDPRNQNRRGGMMDYGSGMEDYDMQMEMEMEMEEGYMEDEDMNIDMDSEF